MSLHDRVSGCYDRLDDDALVQLFHKTFVHPLLPTRNAADNVANATGLHSAFMTLPAVLNMSTWTRHVLAKAKSFRASFKYDGIRVWLLMSSYLPSDVGDNHLRSWLDIYSTRLPTGKSAFSALLDRSGKVWVLYPEEVSGCHRLWEHKTLLEGELCPNIGHNNASYSSTLVLFDCICLAGKPTMIVNKSLDVRSQMVQTLAKSIHIGQTRVIGKTWSTLDHILQDTSVLQDQLRHCVDSDTGLAIDGLVVADNSLSCFDTRRKKNLNKIFKLKQSHTIDLWLSDDTNYHAPNDAGTQQQSTMIQLFCGERYHNVHEIGTSQLSLSRLVPMLLGIPSLEYNPEAFEDYYVDCLSCFKYAISTIFDKQLFQSMGIFGDTVNIMLKIGCDKNSASDQNAALREWLCSQSTCFLDNPSVHSRGLVVEFAVVRGNVNGDSVVFDITPIKIRRDKSFPNSSSVVAQTCVTTLYESSAVGQKDDAGFFPNAFCPKIMKQTLSLVQ